MVVALPSMVMKSADLLEGFSDAAAIALRERGKVYFTLHGRLALFISFVYQLYKG